LVTPPPAAPAKLGIGWKVLLGAICVAVIGMIIADLADSGSADDASTFQPTFPPGGPAEFLYLDTARVATYLAQVEGGTVESEKLTRKLTQNLNAKLAAKELGEVSAARASELFAERTVKPTAASSFFALRTRLEDADVIEGIRPRFFEEDVEGLPEGRFVEFKTSALLPPIYLNAYLAVLHSGTLAAIFPDSPRRRQAALNFFKKVGPAARAVFALQPYALPSESEGSPEASMPYSQRKAFVYLLPITAPLLTSERSLLKYGGGKFTVLGKLVRRFPEPTKRHRPAYVDSATEETWEQALKRAPAELLCRTAPQCARQVRRDGLSTAKRHKAIEKGRERILEALKTQTSIPTRGAVILPIAIYK
jgi:hypothetical protein